MKRVLCGVATAPLIGVPVQTSPLDLAGQGLLAATGVFYLIGGRKQRKWPVRRTFAFLSGLLVVWVAIGSPLANYDDSSVTVHVIQHVLLMMVAPPLLALGRPLQLLVQASSRGFQTRFIRTMGTRWVRIVVHPGPAWLLYLGSMYVMLVDRRVYDFLISHPLAHDASHVGLLVVGWLYWHSLVSSDGFSRTLYPVRIVSILANMPFEVLIGIWLRYQIRSIDPLNSVADTHTAGEAFIVAATLTSTIWLGLVVGQWAAQALREERRELARAAVSPGQWTTPQWVTSTQAQQVAGTIDPGCER